MTTRTGQAQGGGWDFEGGQALPQNSVADTGEELEQE
jgi:hypothetical protein